MGQNRACGITKLRSVKDLAAKLCTLAEGPYVTKKMLLGTLWTLWTRR